MDNAKFKGVQESEQKVKEKETPKSVSNRVSRLAEEQRDLEEEKFLEIIDKNTRVLQYSKGQVIQGFLEVFPNEDSEAEKWSELIKSVQFVIFCN